MQMIVKFYPGSTNVADIPYEYTEKEYDLSDGSLMQTKDKYTGCYSAEAFLNDLEDILLHSNYDVVIIRKVRP